MVSTWRSLPARFPDYALLALIGTSSVYIALPIRSRSTNATLAAIVVFVVASLLLFNYQRIKWQTRNGGSSRVVSQDSTTSQGTLAEKSGSGRDIGNLIVDALLIFAIVYSVCLPGFSSESLVVGIFLQVVFGGLFIVRRGWIEKVRDRLEAVTYEPSPSVGHTKPDTIRAQAEANLQRPLGEAAPQRLEASRLPIYTISLNTIERFSAKQATAFMRAFLSIADRGIVQLSLVGTSGRLTWEIIHFNDEGAITFEEISNLVMTYYPTGVVSQSTATVTEPHYRRFHLFKRNAQRYFDRALSVDDIRNNDPLTLVATALSQLEPGETLRFSVLTMSLYTATEKELERVLTVSAYDAGHRFRTAPVFFRRSSGEALMEDATAIAVTWWRNQGLKKKRVSAYSDAETKHYLEKLSQPLAQCALCLTFDTPKIERLDYLSSVYGAIEELSSNEMKVVEGYTSPNLVIEDQFGWVIRGITVYLYSLVPDSPDDPDLTEEFVFYLTMSELAALWHLPHDGFEKSLLGMKGAQVAVPRALTESRDGIFLGNNRVGARTAAVYLPQSDRTAHTAIIGKTGRGKSSLMHHMLHQDIAAGRGVCLIDPKGKLVSRVLQHSIPTRRERDVLVLDIDTAVDGVFYPPPMNVFLSGNLTADMAAGRLLTVFNTIFDGFADKKMADTLNMALMTVYLKEHPSLLDIHCLFNNPDYRAQLVSRVTNPVVRDFWEQFEAAKEKQQTSDAAPVLWRLRSFYNNERLQTITCHPDRLDLSKLIAKNKIILVSLGDSMGMMPKKERYVLGAALVARIEMAARSGAVTRSPYLLYIDEVQEFVDTSLPEMLSQLREYGLGMVIANQYFAQLFGDTFHALEGTVSTLIGFEVGKSDANALAPYMQPGFAANDLVALGKYKAAVSMVDEEGSRPNAFSLETVPPPGHENTDEAREMYLRRKSVDTFKLKPYDEVLAWVRQNYDCSTPFPSRPEPGDGDRPADGQTRDADDFWE